MRARGSIVGLRCLLVIFALGLASCGRAEPDFAVPVSDWAISREPILRLGVEDGDPRYILYQVLDAKRLRDGSVLVAVVGATELRVYSATGAFQHAFGSRGAGPGEFHPVADLRSWPVGDLLIFAMDAPQRRFHVFTTSGRLVDTRFLPLPLELDGSFWVEDLYSGGAGMLATSALGHLSGEPGDIISTEFRHVRFDTSGAYQGEVLSLQSRKRVVNTYGDGTHYPFLPFSVGDLIAAGPDTSVFVLREGATSLKQYGPSGELIAEFDVAAETPIITSELYAAYRESQLAGMRENRRAAYEALYARDLPIPSHVPFAADIQTDSEGLVWLERYRMPGDSNTSFVVLNPATGALARATMPTRITVYDIGSDFVLGREVESGVERVVMYRLEREIAKRPTSGSTEP